MKAIMQYKGTAKCQIINLFKVTSENRSHLDTESYHNFKTHNNATIFQ